MYKKHSSRRVPARLVTPSTSGLIRHITAVLQVQTGLVLLAAATSPGAAENEDDSGSGRQLKIAKNGKSWWQADYLKPGSDAWRGRVHGFVCRDAALAAAMKEWFHDYLTAVTAYGNLPVGIVASVCRNVAIMYANSVTVHRSDPAEVWSESNIRIVAEMLDASPSTTEQFITQMLRIARNHTGSHEIAPATYSTSHEKAGPYTGAEIEGLIRVVETQSCRRTRWELDAMISVGAGAGAGSRDVRFLRFDEILVDGENVDLVLRGKKLERTVPVAEPWAERLVRLVSERPTSVESPWMIPGARNINLIHRMMDRADWGGVARPLMSRLRTTWTVDRITAGCRIDVLREALGEDSYTSIGKAAAHIAAPGDQEAGFRTEVQR